jgi:hypothetical protein
LEENTGINEETHKVFFHEWIRFGKEVLYEMFVCIPSTSEEARCLEYEWAGLPGCCGSMDATHVGCKHIPHNLQKEHEAFKLLMPA